MGARHYTLTTVNQICSKPSLSSAASGHTSGALRVFDEHVTASPTASLVRSGRGTSCSSPSPTAPHPLHRGSVRSLLSSLLVPLRHRDDPAVQEATNWASSPDGIPFGLEIEWLGTAGFRLTYEDTTILIDPYVSRASLGTVAGRRTLASDRALVDQLLPKADAVLIGHSHFDHAVDVAAIAKRGAAVYGSTSVQNLLGLHGLADRSILVEPHRRYEIGPFAVSFVPSVHSKLIAGWKIPADGELTCDHLDHLTAPNFRCGQVWGIRIEVAGSVFYHQGSADLIEAEVPDAPVDVFLCGIAGRGFTPKFVERALAALNPGIIVAHHHDDFFRSLDQPMGFSFNVNLGGFVEEVGRVAPGLAVHTMTPLTPIAGH